MMSEVLENVEGTCLLEGCPVQAGGSKCVLDLELIACDNYQPPPDVDEGSLGDTSAPANSFEQVEPERITAPPAVTEPDRAAAEAGNDPDSPDPEDEPELDGSKEDGESEDEPTGLSFRSKVRTPEGPRNLIQFSDQHVPIHSGLSLTAEEAQAALADEDLIVVAFVGPARAGKTTLLASLYGNLLARPIGEWSFAGSLSLLGFAMRAYWTTTASGADEAFTERTRRDANRPWLHLQLRGNDGIHGILLGDVSGEHFLSFAGGGSLGPVEGHFRRADHVIHILDTQLLLEVRDRQRALTAAEMLIRRFSESGFLNEDTRQTVLLTKADSCPPELMTMASERAEGWVERYLPGGQVLTVAALPKDGTDARGLVDLLDVILAPRQPRTDEFKVVDLGYAGRRVTGKKLALYRPDERQEAENV